MKVISSLVFGLMLTLNVKAETSIYAAWEGFSSPDIISSGLTHNMYSLPMEGTTYYTGPKFWSGPYWPSNQGGINVRWMSPTKQGFNTHSPSLNELKRMNYNQIGVLSPSEKYDILTGRYDYPLKNEVAQKVSKQAQDWEGLCHGWVLATLHHNEPTSKVFQNRDGIVVPLGSSDIKALLSYYYAEDQKHADHVGLRCNFGTWTGGAVECDQDLNAGAFHIIIANKLGLRNEGLVMDIERFTQVWNQPVVAYRTKILSRLKPAVGAAISTVSEIRVATELFYITESAATWDRVHGTHNQLIDKRDFIYRLELNAQNEIVGGVWESKERPDFIWQKGKETKFTGLLALLPQFLNDDTRPVQYQPKKDGWTK